MQKKINNSGRGLILITTFCACAVLLIACDVPKYTPMDYNGSTFSEVWGKVQSDPYPTLPRKDVTVESFFIADVNELIFSSVRTINERNDILPYFDKLLHPNGVCLSGTWNIDQENPYTGYFSNGSSALIIVRASVALSQTERGNYRGFGFTGKIFPTTDIGHIDPLETANFFTIDNLAGTLAQNYLDVVMTNEPLVFSPGADDIFDVALVSTFSLGLADTHVGIRQLYEISELGMSNPENALTPHWIKIEATPGQIRVDANDFRDELDVSNYPGGEISFDISVTTPDSTKLNKTWLKIGYILLDDYVASESCDHCLHFHHPEFKEINTQ